jgi:hypothetical protein
MAFGFSLCLHSAMIKLHFHWLAVFFALLLYNNQTDTSTCHTSRVSLEYFFSPSLLYLLLVCGRCSLLCFVGNHAGYRYLLRDLNFIIAPSDSPVSLQSGNLSLKMVFVWVGFMKIFCSTLFLKLLMVSDVLWRAEMIGASGIRRA